jgi:P pilus assembly chaperone PapD
MSQSRLNSMMRRAQALLACTLCFFAAILLAHPALGQSVSPIISEYQGNTKSSFDVANTTNEPLNVVLETFSFTVDEDGKMSFRPLKPEDGIEVQLSSMSFRVPPHQSYTVFYSAKAKTLPSWFVVYANFRAVSKSNQTGFNIQLELPHVIYLLPKKGHLEKSEIRVNVAEFDRSKKMLRLEVENMGANVGRLKESTVSAGKKVTTTFSGALFPHSRRRFEMAWEQQETPESLELTFGNFKIEQPINAKE